MLTKDLLETKKRDGYIKPQYRDEGSLEVAREVIDEYREGRTKKEIWDSIEEMETHDNFKFLRGLSKIIERNVEFEVRSPGGMEASEIREKLFERGYVTSKGERNRVIAEVAQENDGITTRDIREGFWADREENEVLVSNTDNLGLSPEDLLRQYNLSLTQTLLFDATDLEFKVSNNFQEIFRTVKYLGLMYTVDEDLNVTVTGPASLFKKTRKYGTTLAKVIPSIMKAEDWEIQSKVETTVSGQDRVYDFYLNSDSQKLFPDKEVNASYDSEVERSLVSRIEFLLGEEAEGWEINHEPTILRTDRNVMIPDFSFEKRGREFYLEVVGFWTPEYLEEKIKKVRQVEKEKPMMLAVNNDLNCREEDFNTKTNGEDEDEELSLFFYNPNKKISVKPVFKRLREIEDEIIQDDLEKLNQQGQGLEIDAESEAVDIHELADREGVETKAMKQYLEERESEGESESGDVNGVVSGTDYLPSDVIDQLREEIDSIESETETETLYLSDIKPVLEEYGLGESILEEIGYTVVWTSLSQEEAEVRSAN